MEDFSWAEINAIRSRLKLIIDDIVLEHRVAGDILTWNLMHEIEEKAFEHIKASRDLDASYAGMLKSSRLRVYKRTDDPVDFGESNAIPTAFMLIHQAFTRVDA
ncbi:DUF2471 family protein [Herbaspirillum sp. GCM10030257]|uniref:DUF2471 family protein n=1 Tax=Herbaspirillum sp. GCM10030257 TaxID=3273393 RepID=UPI003623DA8B